MVLSMNSRFNKFRVSLMTDFGNTLKGTNFGLRSHYFYSSNDTSFQELKGES